MKKILKYLLKFFLVFLFSSLAIATEGKVKIGLLVPITGENKDLGKQIIQSVRIAVKDINSENIEIYLKDTNSNPETTIKSAKELRDIGINIVIGPVFYKNLTYLDKVQEITFLSLTNKTLNLPDNVISGGVCNFTIEHN